MRSACQQGLRRGRARKMAQAYHHVIERAVAGDDNGDRHAAQQQLAPFARRSGGGCVLGFGVRLFESMSQQC